MRLQPEHIRLQVIMPAALEHFPKANVKPRSLRIRTPKSKAPSWCPSPLPPCLRGAAGGAAAPGLPWAVLVAPQPCHHPAVLWGGLP